ncbi:MAG: zinc ribbon domain-containing protein [Gemmatimonadetes bacterium]|nr:zinc ribbon domain-containing protein [Gemmatimonadota bacterium]
MNAERLAGLLARRMGEAGRAGEGVVSVAELHRTLLPYHICRSALGYATKAEYDLELLELLAGERYLVPTESELRSAVRDERASPEPGLGFLKNLSAAQLRIQVADEVNAAAVPAPAPATSHPDVSVAPGEVSVVSRDVSVVPREAPGPDAGASLETPGRCWRCDLELPDREGLRYCVFCGSDQLRPRCRQCDEQLEAEWRYCLACGSQRSAATD